jgi:hypothetical protein
VATEDTTLYGYRVPKGWSVNLDYRAVMCRDSYFPEADQFRPERFDVSERNGQIDGQYNPQMLQMLHELLSICAQFDCVAVTDLCTPLYMCAVSLIQCEEYATSPTQICMVGICTSYLAFSALRIDSLLVKYHICKTCW